MSRLLLALLTVFLLSPLYANQQGMQYLQSIRDVNGSTIQSSRNAFPLQAVAQMLESSEIIQLTLDDTFISLANIALTDSEHNVSETLARKIALGIDASGSLQQLLSHQNPDGGFGDDTGYHSTVIDTAFALKALFHADASTTSMQNALLYLLDRQRTDGSWGEMDNEPSVYLTALATHALWLFRKQYDLESALTSAKSYLESGRTAGLWGDHFESACAMIALAPLYASSETLQSSVDALLAAQEIDGSWSHDPYTTALVLQALFAAASPTPNPDLGAISGTIVDADTAIPLSGISVTLSGTSDASISSDPNGAFTLTGLEAGEYTLQISATNYRSITARMTLAASQSADLGTIRLSRLSDDATSATVYGVVSDNLGAPIADATVSLGTWQVQTASDGSYQINDIAAGSYVVTASAATYQSAVAEIDLTAGSVLIFSPSLQPTTEDQTPDATVQGTVRDIQTLNPLSGVLVTLSDGTSTLSGSDGSYTLQSTQYGKQTVRFSKTGYQTLDFNIHLSDYTTIALSPYLVSEGASGYDNANTAGIAGVIVDSRTNEPITEAVILATFDGAATEYASAADGTFTIEGIHGSDLNLSISKAGYVPVQFATYVTPMQTVQIGQIRLRPETAESLLPDLVPVSIDVNLSGVDPQTLALETELHASFKNIGNAPSNAPVRLTAFYDSDSDGNLSAADTVLGEAEYGYAVGIDEEVNLTVVLSGTLPFRNAPISVWVDSAEVTVELDELNNVQDSRSACDHKEKIDASLNAVTKWLWEPGETNSEYYYVVSTPLIAPLIDTNNDASVNSKDIPAVFFISIAGGYDKGGVIRAVRGDNGDEIWTANDAKVAPVGNLAVGDIDGDGNVEIVAPGQYGGIVAYDHEGHLKWFNQEVSLIGGWKGTWGGPSLADLDADGSTEIVFGAAVLDSNGTLLWQDITCPTPTFGAISVLADINGDGRQDILTGTRAYDMNGSILWSNQNINPGYPAVLDIEKDGTPEIAVVANSNLYILDNKGNKLIQTYIPGGGGGPATIADFDSDGLPEIGVVGRYYYTVFDTDGSVLWNVSANDTSSGVVGSSAFDFENDGNIEIVFSDHSKFQILNGKDGTTKLDFKHYTLTGTDYPVVADIDNDDHADIVFCGISNDNVWLRAIQGVNNTWANTRKIWNQHSYHINNINDDGSIPRHEQSSWVKHNTYRYNSFIAPRATPDLAVSLLHLHDNGADANVTLSLRVSNGGAIASPDAALTLYDGETALRTVTVGTLETNSYTDLLIELSATVQSGTITALIDPENAINECDETNNRVSVPFTPVAAVGDIAVSLDQAIYVQDTNVTMTARLSNPGRFDHTLNATLQIVTPSGELVAESTPIDPETIASGATRLHTRIWNSGRTLTGSYRLVGRLYDADGVLIDEATTDFEIMSDVADGIAASLDLYTDRLTYHTRDTVALTQTVQNFATNAILSGAALVLDVRHTDGTVIYTSSDALDDLVPEGILTWQDGFALNDVAEGNYTVTGTLLDADDTLLATDTTRFTVRTDLTRTLFGTVTVDHTEVSAGDAQRCVDTLTYLGSAPLNAQPIRQLLVDLESNATVTADDQPVSLERMQTIVLERGIDTTTLDAGAYACVLQAADDARWNTLGLARFTLIKPERFVQIAYNLQTGSHGRVLILADPCDEAPCETDHLQTLLNDAGIAHTLTTDACSFALAFRSGTYQSYALLSEQIKLSDDLQSELIEAVYRGDGMLVAGDHDHRNGKLDPLFGVTVNGKHSKVDGLSIRESEEFTAVSLAFAADEKPLKLQSDATLIATYDNDAAAMFRTLYHDGPTLYSGADLLLHSSGDATGAFDRLLLESLRAVMPKHFAALPSGVLPLALTLTNEGDDVNGTTLTYLYTPEANVTDPGAGFLQPDGSLAWTYALEVNATATLEFLVTLPQTGTLDLETMLYVHEAGQSTLYGAYSDTFALEEVVTLESLTALMQQSSDKNIGKALAKAEKAQDYVLLQDDAKALDELLKAVAFIKASDADEAETIRLQLAHVLRLLAMKLETCN